MQGPLEKALIECKRDFIAVAGFSLAINLLMLAVPIYMLQLFDRVLSSSSTETLILLTIIVIVALAVFALLEAIRGHVMTELGTWLDRQLGPPILSGSVTLNLRGPGEPSVQGLRDLGTFRTFLAGPAMFPILDAPWMPNFVAIIFVLHPLLGWVALGGALVLFGLAVANELASRKPLAKASGLSIRALNQAESVVRNADAIEAMGMMPNLIKRWREKNSEMLELQGLASVRSGRISALSKFCRMVLQVSMLGTGAWLALEGELSPGAMIAGSILMARALAPVEQAIGSWKQMVSARGAYRRMKGQLAAAPPPSETMPLPAPDGRVEAEAETYAHPGATEPTLRSVSFTLVPGESMGLIGPSASGKTTLARLIVGNLQPRVGHLRLDSMDVAEWHSEDRGRHVGYLPQDVELFPGSVRDNIARMGEAQPEAVIDAARIAGVHEMILRLPQGYDTEIGESGASLSGGERKRIALARALYGTPKLVVLDEPSAGLDQAGEQALLDAIETLKEREVTLIVIAHRPSALRPTKLKNHWLRAYCEHWTKNCRTSEPSVSSTSSVISVSKSNRPAKGAKAKDVDG